MRWRKRKSMNIPHNKDMYCLECGLLPLRGAVFITEATKTRILDGMADKICQNGGDIA